MKVLVVVDMQNDFITGSLGTKEAQAIVPNVKKKIEEAVKNGDLIIFTRDTHWSDYLASKEGKKLPVEHCIRGTDGWEICDGLVPDNYNFMTIRNKLTFGDEDLPGELDDMLHFFEYKHTEIELVGLCTDICVVSNALLLKAALYDGYEISVDASCCAGTTPENHKAALQVMKCCQINVIGE